MIISSMKNYKKRLKQCGGSPDCFLLINQHGTAKSERRPESF